MHEFNLGTALEDLLHPLVEFAVLLVENFIGERDHNFVDRVLLALTNQGAKKADNHRLACGWRQRE